VFLLAPFIDVFAQNGKCGLSVIIVSAICANPIGLLSQFSQLFITSSKKSRHRYHQEGHVVMAVYLKINKCHRINSKIRLIHFVLIILQKNRIRRVIVAKVCD
jgi:hypothetical protein